MVGTVRYAKNGIFFVVRGLLGGFETILSFVKCLFLKTLGVEGCFVRGNIQKLVSFLLM